VIARKPLCLLACFVFACLINQASLVAQAKKTQGAEKKNSATTSDPSKTPAKPGTPAQTANKDGTIDMVLPTPDGWQIHCTWFESAAGRESACAILLTATDGLAEKDARNRRVWQPTALALQKAGFAVITVDLRKHGDSIPTSPTGEPLTMKISNADYPLMASSDLETVKAFLMEQHKAEKLNIRKLGIVAMGSSAMVAAAFTIEDWAKTPYPDAPTIDQRTPRGQDVRSLIMYSPNTTVRGLNTTALLKTLKGIPVPVYVVAAKDNKEDARNADKVFKAVELKGDQFKDTRKLLLTNGQTHAEAYLEGQLATATQKDIIDFLTRNVKDLEVPWIDRTDRRTK
jgi:predicted alpha/beta hydrolase